MLKSCCIALGLIVAASIAVSARQPVTLKTAAVAVKDQSRLTPEPDARPQKFSTWAGPEAP